MLWPQFLGLKVFVLVLTISLDRVTPDNEICQWYGTAPFCVTDQETCKKNDMVFTERHNDGGGKSCWFGEKVRCCITRDVSYNLYCRWTGTSPFCFGDCESSENEVRRDCWGDGNYCIFGSKAYCAGPVATEETSPCKYIASSWSLRMPHPKIDRLIPLLITIYAL